MADITGIVPGVRTIELHHPASESRLVGIRLQILSLDDDKLTKLKREFTDDYLRMQQRNKTQKAEQIEENSTRLLIAAIKGWDWYNPTGQEGDEGYDPEAMPSLNGEVPAYNQKNVKALLELPWARKQINTEIEDTKAFFEE